MFWLRSVLHCSRSRSSSGGSIGRLCGAGCCKNKNGRCIGRVRITVSKISSSSSISSSGGSNISCTQCTVSETGRVVISPNKLLLLHRQQCWSTRRADCRRALLTTRGTTDPRSWLIKVDDGYEVFNAAVATPTTTTTTAATAAITTATITPTTTKIITTAAARAATSTSTRRTVFVDADPPSPVLLTKLAARQRQTPQRVLLHLRPLQRLRSTGLPERSSRIDARPSAQHQRQQTSTSSRPEQQEEQERQPQQQQLQQPEQQQQNQEEREKQQQTHQEELHQQQDHHNQQQQSVIKTAAVWNGRRPFSSEQLSSAGIAATAGEHRGAIANNWWPILSASNRGIGYDLTWTARSNSTTGTNCKSYSSNSCSNNSCSSSSSSKNKKIDSDKLSLHYSSSASTIFDSKSRSNIFRRLLDVHGSGPRQPAVASLASHLIRRDFRTTFWALTVVDQSDSTMGSQASKKGGPKAPHSGPQTPAAPAPPAPAERAPQTAQIDTPTDGPKTEPVEANGNATLSHTASEAPIDAPTSKTTNDGTDGRRHETSVPEKTAAEDPIKVSQDEWRRRLDRETFKVCRLKGTEYPGSGKYLHHTEKGTYICVCCRAELFRSEDKFNHCGWPSFRQALGTAKDGSDEMTNVKREYDGSLGMVRTEVLCRKCDSHLGHVFDDGPEPFGRRFCINSVSLDFVKD